MQHWNGYFFISTNYLTQWSTVLPQKLTDPQPVTRCPTVYRTQSLISPFTTDPHLSLSSAISTQYKPHHPTSWRSILILSSPSTTKLSIKSLNRTLYATDKTNHTIMTGHSSSTVSLQWKIKFCYCFHIHNVRRLYLVYKTVYETCNFIFIGLTHTQYSVYSDRYFWIYKTCFDTILQTIFIIIIYYIP